MKLKNGFLPSMLTQDIWQQEVELILCRGATPRGEFFKGEFAPTWRSRAYTTVVFSSVGTYAQSWYLAFF
jgi:hypothetical protein